VDVLKKFRVEENIAEGNLSNNQKLAVAGLTVFGIFIIVFWAAGMRNNISRPFAVKQVEDATQTACIGGDCASSKEQLSKITDTDGDGLSDWDELNIYFTSPYIEDSDSDGLGDGAEVRAGQNPNCPSGQDCGQATASAGTSVEADSDAAAVDDEPVFEDIYLTPDQVQQNEGDLNKLFGGQADPAVLRKLLLESGAEKDLLDQMTDEQLTASYLSTLQSAMESGQ